MSESANMTEWTTIALDRHTTKPRIDQYRNEQGCSYDTAVNQLLDLADVPEQDD